MLPPAWGRERARLCQWHFQRQPRASWGPHTRWQRKGRDFLDPRQSQTLVPGEKVGGVGVEEGHLRDYLQSPGLTFLDPSPTFQ